MAGEQGRQHKGETRSPCPEPDPPAGLLGGTQREGQRQEKQFLLSLGSWEVSPNPGLAKPSQAHTKELLPQTEFPEDKLQ